MTVSDILMTACLLLFFLSLRAPLHSWHSPLPRLSYFLVKKCPITYRHIKFHKMNKWIINHWFLQWPWHCIVIWPWQFDHSSSSKTKYNVYIGPCKRTSQTYLYKTPNFLCVHIPQCYLYVRLCIPIHKIYTCMYVKWLSHNEKTEIKLHYTKFLLFYSKLAY